MSEEKIYPSMVIRSQAEAIELLEKENQQLKEENDYYFKKNIELSTLNTSLRSDRDLYKEVIEEVREYIESKNNGVCIINGEEKPAYTFLLDFEEAREFVWELLQILDKAKED